MAPDGKVGLWTLLIDLHSTEDLEDGWGASVVDRCVPIASNGGFLVEVGRQGLGGQAGWTSCSLGEIKILLQLQHCNVIIEGDFPIIGMIRQFFHLKGGGGEFLSMISV